MKNLIKDVECHSKILCSTLYPLNSLTDPIEIVAIDVTIVRHEIIINPCYGAWWCLIINRWLAHKTLYAPKTMNFVNWCLIYKLSAFLIISHTMHTIALAAVGTIKAIFTSLVISGMMINTEQMIND